MVDEISLTFLDEIKNMVSIELSIVLFINASWASLSKSDESLRPLKIKFVALALTKSTVNPLNEVAETLVYFLATIYAILSLSFKENIDDFALSSETAIITSSKDEAALFIISSWPSVSGSKEPG